MKNAEEVAKGGGGMKVLTPRQVKEQMEVCPFCACSPNVFQVPDLRFNNPGWVIECKNMGCIFKRSSPNQSLTNLKRDWNERKAAGK